MHVDNLVGFIYWHGSFEQVCVALVCDELVGEFLEALQHGRWNEASDTATIERQNGERPLLLGLSKDDQRRYEGCKSCSLIHLEMHSINFYIRFNYYI